MDFLTYVEEMTYLGWFTFGLVLVLLELFLPGTYLIWFGLAAFVMGVLVNFVLLSGIEILVYFALVSAVFAGIGWYVYTKIINKSKVPEKYKYLNDMAGAHIGKVYNLSEDAVDGRAKAKIGDTFWLIEVDGNLKKGDKVKITGVENGVILKAEKYKG